MLIMMIAAAITHWVIGRPCTHDVDKHNLNHLGLMLRGTLRGPLPAGSDHHSSSTRSSTRRKAFAVSFIKQFVRFVVARKKYWLVPVFVLLLLVGSLLVFSKGSVFAPLIYTLY